MLTGPESSASVHNPQAPRTLLGLWNASLRQDPGLDLRKPFPKQIEPVGALALLRDGARLVPHDLHGDPGRHLHLFGASSKHAPRAVNRRLRQGGICNGKDAHRGG